MSTVQIAAPAQAATTLQIVPAAWRRVAQDIAGRYRKHRQARVIARLPEYLRHDIGETDIRPDRKLDRTEQAPASVTREDLLLRYR